jgi:sterol desaturase/sphingolipid hydroxylase (fatty acid hydroxylase superfamily)
LTTLPYTAALVLILAAPPEAVIVFEVLLNATSLFNHGNVRLPKWLESAARLLIITPDLHRVHHSILPHETHSNSKYGIAVLPIWFP